MLSNNPPQFHHQPVNLLIVFLDASKDIDRAPELIWLCLVRILGGQIEVLDIPDLHNPGFRRIFALLGQGYYVTELRVGDRLVLGERAAGIDFVVPDVFRASHPVEKHDVGLHSRIREEHPGRQRYDGMEVEIREEYFFDILERRARIEEDAFGNDDTHLPAEPYLLSDVLDEEHFGGGRLDGKIGLDLFLLLASERGIREDDFEPVLLLDIPDVGRQGVLLADIGIVDSVENHVHDPEDVGQRGFLVPEERLVIEFFEVGIGPDLGPDVAERLDEESAAPRGRVVDALSDLGVHEIDDEFDNAPRGIEFAGIPTVVAHALQEVLVDFGELEEVFLVLEVEPVHDIEYFPERVPALNLIIEEIEYFADLVLDGMVVPVRVAESLKVGEQVVVHEVLEVVAGDQFPVPGYPVRPPVRIVEDMGIFLAIELSAIGFPLLEIIEELKEEDPGNLLCIVHGTGYPIVSAEDVSDAVDLLLHGYLIANGVMKGIYMFVLLVYQPSFERVLEEALLEFFEGLDLGFEFEFEGFVFFEDLVEMGDDLFLFFQWWNRKFVVFQKIFCNPLQSYSSGHVICSLF